jgi:signal transduction histidine kinase
MDAEGLVAANGPDPRALVHELEHARRVIQRLRDPVGAVRLAVQILTGPLRSVLGTLPEEDGMRVQSVLASLDDAAGELCRLVSDPAGRTAALPPMPAPGPLAPTPAEATKTAKVCALDDVLRRLEVMTVTRSSASALLAIDAEPGLAAALPGPVLLGVLTHLVENGVAASTRTGRSEPPTIDIRAWTEPAEVLGDAQNVVVEVRDRGPGMPDAVRRWLRAPLASTGGCPCPPRVGASTHGLGLRAVRRIVEGVGGWVECAPADPGTFVRVRVPADTAGPPKKARLAATAIPGLP